MKTPDCARVCKCTELGSKGQSTTLFLIFFISTDLGSFHLTSSLFPLLHRSILFSGRMFSQNQSWLHKCEDSSPRAQRVTWLYRVSSVQLAQSGTLLNTTLHKRQRWPPSVNTTKRSTTCNVFFFSKETLGEKNHRVH